MKREAVAQLQEPVLTLIHTVYRLRDAARRRMYGLQRDFNEQFPNAFLRLRPWSRAVGRPPYSLCWVRIFAGTMVLNPKTLSASHRPNPFPFRRLPIRKNRDLDTAIHRCQLDAHRSEVFDFHRKAHALNQAAHDCSRALDGTRKVLSGRAATPGPCDESWIASTVYLDTLPSDLARLLGRLQIFTATVRAEVASLAAIASDYRREPWCEGLDLVFVTDLGYPFGRLLWVERLGLEEFGRLGPRLRSRLRLDARQRALATRTDRAMSRLARLLLRRHATFQKLHRLLSAAQATAEPILARVTVKKTLDESLNEWRGGPAEMIKAPWERKARRRNAL